MDLVLHEYCRLNPAAPPLPESCGTPCLNPAAPPLSEGLPSKDAVFIRALPFALAGFRSQIRLCVALRRYAGLCRWSTHPSPALRLSKIAWYAVPKRNNRDSNLINS